MTSSLERTQGARAEARPVGASLDSALAGLERAKGQLQRDQQALAAAQARVQAALTAVQDAEQRVEQARLAAVTRPPVQEDETQHVPHNLAGLLAMSEQAERELARDASTGAAWIAKLRTGLRAAASNLPSRNSYKSDCCPPVVPKGDMDCSEAVDPAELEAVKKRLADATDCDACIRELLSKRSRVS